MKIQAGTFVWNAEDEGEELHMGGVFRRLSASCTHSLTAKRLLILFCFYNLSLPHEWNFNTKTLKVMFWWMFSFTTILSTQLFLIHGALTKTAGLGTFISEVYFLRYIRTWVRDQVATNYYRKNSLYLLLETSEINSKTKTSRSFQSIS